MVLTGLSPTSRSARPGLPGSPAPGRLLGYPELVELPKFWPTWVQLIGACWGIGTGDATELRGLGGDLNATIAQAVTDVIKTAPNGVHLRFVEVNTGAAGIGAPDQNLFEPSTGTRHNLRAWQPWINGRSPRCRIVRRARGHRPERST